MKKKEKKKRVYSSQPPIRALGDGTQRREKKGRAAVMGAGGWKTCGRMGAHGRAAGPCGRHQAFDQWMARVVGGKIINDLTRLVISSLEQAHLGDG